MKKIFILSVLGLYSTSALSLDVKVDPQSKNVSDTTQLTLEGLLNFQSGFASQKNLVSEDQYISGNRRNIAFYTESYFAACLEQKAEAFTYGGKIVLVPTTKIKTSPSYNGSHIFFKSEFGKVELGSPYDAGSKLRVEGSDVSAGGDWAKYLKVNDTNTSYMGLDPELADSSDFFYDIVFRTKQNQISDKAEPSRKVSFYTPNLSGFRFGISYIPDTGNGGGAPINSNSAGISEIKIKGTDNTYVFNKNIKDGFSAGLSYEHNISDGVDVKVAVSGEYGKSAGKLNVIENKGQSNERIVNSFKLSDLKSYNLGLNLTYGNFSYGASYGTLGKSLTSKEFNKTGRDTKYYNGAVAYGQGPIKTSISYFKSNQFTNTLNSVTLGSEYKLAPGLLPYAELSYFRAKGKPSFYPEAPRKKTKGTVGILGAKLKF